MKKLATQLMTVIMTILFLGTSAYGQDVGETAPEFKYRSLTGDSIALSDHSGKVVFLFLFGNTCPFCIAIGNDTETRINDVFKSESDFIALGLDQWDGSSSVTTVNAFKNQTGISYPLLLKAGSMSSLYSTTYDRAIVIGQDGIIRHKGTSRVASDIDNAIATIQSLLGLTSNEGPDEYSSTALVSYPNPVLTTTTFKFRLKMPGVVKLRIFNSMGQEMIEGFNMSMVMGEHSVVQDLTGLPQGTYFCVLETHSGYQYTRLVKVNR